ncbi:transcriptional regulator, TetR family [Gilliamella bombicola]|uniref:Transcriptional regulator, TetR family n=1 Tax=Gilliamella bombicola TaxID=1798182 RepID=A0A1C3YWD5_9GAMM|nr:MULTISPECIES: TetR/AcrR family transcriptional regulator [Gilliamella]MWN04753.1 TetR family transcriptional regulator [Gilliamella sp. Pas-s95]NUF27514.1 helix-turn-helix transcriptional regulator [Gilliamella sp. ESL0254]SCB74380.1 transcriptional regulator, TetR family [Gilliamella bombicola]
MKNTTADKLLNSAERLFAQASYSEVSIRDITEDAGVKLALVHYHFGSKEELFKAVIRRRIGKLSSDRIRLLNYYKNQNGDEPMSLEKIVESFLAPYLYNTLYGGEGWRYYAINVARLLSSGSALGLSILCEQFDPYAEFFIVELKRAYPSATKEQIHWGFDFLVGLMCNTFAEADRIKFLSHDICSIENPEIACQYLYHYSIEGLHAVLTKPKYDYQSTFDIIKSFSNIDSSF